MSVLPDRFLNKKHPHSTANATSYVSRQVPLNVQEAPASTTFNFRIGTLPNTFIDPSASFLKYTVVNSTDHCTFEMGAAGAPALIETITLLNSGSQLSQYQNYGVFRTMKNSLNCSSDWLSGPGCVMQGTKAENMDDLGLVGEKLVPGESRTFVDPICNHTSLFNCGKYISLDLVDNLDLRYTFGDAFYGGAWSEGAGTSEIGGLTDSALKIKGLELVLTLVQLDGSTASQLRAAHPDNNICYECRGIGRISATIPQGVSGHNVNLGLGYSSLMALNAVMLPKKKGDIVNDRQTLSVENKTDHQNSTFVSNYLKNWLFLIDGSPIENQRPIRGDPAEIAAFQQIATGNLHKFDGQFKDYNNHDVAYENHAEEGQNLSGAKGYVLSQELCIYKQKSGHWADSEMAVMCEGRGTLSSSTSFAFEFEGSSGEQVQLEVFPEYRQLIVLDSNTKTYRVSQ